MYDFLILINMLFGIATCSKPRDFITHSSKSLKPVSYTSSNFDIIVGNKYITIEYEKVHIRQHDFRKVSIFLLNKNHDELLFQSDQKVVIYSILTKKSTFFMKSSDEVFVPQANGPFLWRFLSSDNLTNSNSR